MGLSHHHHHHLGYEEEEKGDGSMRAPKQKNLILGEDHGSSGNNQ